MPHAAGNAERVWYASGLSGDSTAPSTPTGMVLRQPDHFRVMGLALALYRSSSAWGTGRRKDIVAALTARPEPPGLVGERVCCRSIFRALGVPGRAGFFWTSGWETR